ncbi:MULTISPECIES: DUF1847 domain-containing protein [Clostridium]|uniref:Metal-binding protein n=2 Tax=Clostridium TaxID=1485 RepID=D8GMV9_CLOLD|nr:MULTISPECIES: DUF1847 domain-containing protein [Clostridium]ADK15747.1 conserved hypothetical protein [Clostridium ljungdahlii DSM 13528]OAA86376.1 hypothetical protein WX45_04040 [Clostridium ljungdahlii DSM 13528]RMD03055.1 DUF1847 domain-containing protein [Clostridium autoethanogenum]
MYYCALCTIHACNKKDLDKAPKNCPSLDEKMKKIKEVYKDEENFKIAKASALVVSEGYGEKTRLEETIDFAKRCQYKNIGIAFCVGLSNEAKILSKVLSYNGFTVNSVICKNGGISKDFIDIDSNVPMCNPIGQANFLNEAKTDLNIILGLCVGHDSLFIKYSEAPITVFAVKDRILAHNPLGAIYQADSYYKDKLFPKKK